MWMFQMMGKKSPAATFHLETESQYIRKVAPRARKRLGPSIASRQGLRARGHCKDPENRIKKPDRTVDNKTKG